MDTLEHLTALSREQLASIEKVRLAKEGLGPTLPFAVLPRTVKEATVVSGPAWWATRTWAGMRELHGLTLVDVPKQCRAKYADLVVVQVIIAEIESAEPAMLAGDPARAGLDEAQCGRRHSLELHSVAWGVADGRRQQADP